MRISLTAVTKTFGRETVFKGVDLVLGPGSRTAILGPNGSGKSTLLQVIAGAAMPTSGVVAHELNGSALEADVVYRHISIAAPYLGLYEDLSLEEAIDTHCAFKPLRGAPSVMDVARTALLEKDLHKPVRNFSSGMKQRLKLTLAILSDTPLLLLDEPGSNLDASGLGWYRELLNANLEGRTLVVASNRQAEETFACPLSVEVSGFK
jgi:ABC-type multidrug transport system ATPase subunit